MADMVNRVNVYRHAEFHADGVCWRACTSPRV